MTGVPGRDAPWPGWARQWSPRTKDGARALALYTDATVDRIADALPGFAEGADRDMLAGLIRQLASQVIAIRRGASPDTAKDVRDKLKRADAALRELATAFDELPDIAKGVMADWQPAGAAYDDWVRNLAGLLSAPRKAREMAAKVEKMTQAVKISRGRSREDELLWAIKELCGIYETVTGRLPGRDYNHYSGHDGGPFKEFVAAAIKPLWPKKGRVGRHVRVAVRWYKRPRSAG
jgi:hypothetical protein